MQQYFLDERAKKPGNAKNSMNGKVWYEQQTLRALNQAAGRVIRHIKDYGIIIFADSRYQWSTYKGKLSSWVQKSLIKVDNSA